MRFHRLPLGSLGQQAGRQALCPRSPGTPRPRKKMGSDLGRRPGLGFLESEPPPALPQPLIGEPKVHLGFWLHGRGPLAIHAWRLHPQQGLLSSSLSRPCRRSLSMQCALCMQCACSWFLSGSWKCLSSPSAPSPQGLPSPLQPPSS